MVEKNPQKAKGACSIIREFIGSSSNKGLGHLIQTTLVQIKFCYNLPIETI